MQIVGVAHPGSPAVVRLHVGHGMHPRVALWRRGWVMQTLLSCQMNQTEVVLTARVVERSQKSRPPKVKHRSADPNLMIAEGEVPIIHQRIAA